jgi:hypothetical protein
MNMREFNAALNTISTTKKGKRRIDPDKIRMMNEDQAARMLLYIVRHRGPIVKQMVERANADYQWLAACGYLYETKGPQSGLTFIHTCEHVIR